MSKNSNKTSKNKKSYKGSKKASSEGQSNANLEPLGELGALENLRQRSLGTGFEGLNQASASSTPSLRRDDPQAPGSSAVASLALASIPGTSRGSGTTRFVRSNVQNVELDFDTLNEPEENETSLPYELMGYIEHILGFNPYYGELPALDETRMSSGKAEFKLTLKDNLLPQVEDIMVSRMLCRTARDRLIPLVRAPVTQDKRTIQSHEVRQVSHRLDAIKEKCCEYYSAAVQYSFILMVKKQAHVAGTIQKSIASLLTAAARVFQHYQPQLDRISQDIMNEIENDMLEDLNSTESVLNEILTATQFEPIIRENADEISANNRTNAQIRSHRNAVPNDFRRPTPNPSIIAETVEPQRVPANEGNRSRQRESLPTEIDERLRRMEEMIATMMDSGNSSRSSQSYQNLPRTPPEPHYARVPSREPTVQNLLPPVPRPTPQPQRQRVPQQLNEGSIDVYSDEYIASLPDGFNVCPYLPTEEFNAANNKLIPVLLV